MNIKNKNDFFCIKIKMSISNTIDLCYLKIKNKYEK